MAEQNNDLAKREMKKVPAYGSSYKEDEMKDLFERTWNFAIAQLKEDGEMKSAFVIPTNESVEMFEHDTQEEEEEAIAKVNKKAIELRPPAIIRVADSWMAPNTPDGKPPRESPERKKAVAAYLIKPDGSVSFHRYQFYSNDIVFGERIEGTEDFKQYPLKRWDISDKSLEPVEQESAVSKPNALDELVTQLLEEFRAHNDKDKPFGAYVPIMADCARKSATVALRVACRLRRSFPAEAWIALIQGPEGLSAIHISCGKEPLVKGKMGDSILFYGPGDWHVEPLLAGESWEDCVKRMSPNHDQPIAIHKMEGEIPIPISYFTNLLRWKSIGVE